MIPIQAQALCRLRYFRAGSAGSFILVDVRTLALALLACLSIANFIRIGAAIPWNEISTDVMKIARGDGTDDPSVSDRNYQVIRQTLAELNVHDTVGYLTDRRPGDDFLAE